MDNSTIVHVAVEYNKSTEVLIIISQTVFFVLLFLLLKHGLVDKRGMMGTYDLAIENSLQLGAIYFAIVMMLIIVMIPVENYRYGHFVVPLTFGIILTIMLWEFKRIYAKRFDLPSRHPPKEPKVSKAPKAPKETKASSDYAF